MEKKAVNRGCCTRCKWEREREWIKNWKKEKRLRGMIQWKSCLSNPILYAYFFFNLSGIGHYRCIAQCYFWHPISFLCFLLGELLAERVFFCCMQRVGTVSGFCRFCLYTVPFLVMPLGSVMIVIEPTVQCAAVCPAQMRASLFSINWGGPPFRPSFNPKLVRNCKY